MLTCAGRVHLRASKRIIHIHSRGLPARRRPIDFKVRYTRINHLRKATMCYLATQEARVVWLFHSLRDAYDTYFKLFVTTGSACMYKSEARIAKPTRTKQREAPGEDIKHITSSHGPERHLTGCEHARDASLVLFLPYVHLRAV